MRALIQKDCYVLWKQMKIFLVVMVVIMVGNGAFGSVFIVIWCAMLPYTAIAYDERCKWDQLAAMMPYTPRDLVLSKYVLGWLCAGGAGALALAMQLIAKVLPGSVDCGTPLSVLLSFCGSICILSITLPLMLRFGVERGRMVMFVLIFLVCGGAGAIGSFISSGSMPGNPAALLSAAAAAGALAAAVLTAVSIPLSLRLYAARR